MSHRRRLPAAVLALSTVLASLTFASPAVSAAPVPAPATLTSEVASGWTPRPETYPGTVKKADLKLPMSDGVALRGDLILPAGADGTAVQGDFPVIVEITAYNKQVILTGGGGLAGGDPKYLVKRGYAFLVVDARGTGTSPGSWQVFGDREQQDAAEIVEWAAEQTWSNGSVGMVGASYMGISQLFAAGRHPEGLKAIFPQVPGADVYRDIAATGGQLDVGFMPLWLGLVNLTGMIPSGDGGLAPLTQILGRLAGTGAPTLELALSALVGGPRAYDGPWYRERSPIEEAVPAINVPTFLVGGEYDLFQRGTPMVFQNLQERGVPVKMILGPWDHLQGSSAAGIDAAGYGTLNELWLRWFDRYVMEIPDPDLDTDIPDFTYHEIGSGDWVQRDGYLTDQRATTYRLSGGATTGLAKGDLVQGTASPGTATVLPLPVQGLCTRSATQWTAGVLGMTKLQLPCDTDNRLNDLSGVVYETAPLTEDLEILGPINARLFASSPTGDGMLSVHVSRVAADGRVERLTGGWQVLSMAALDENRSVKLDGQVIQPWHPYTKESRRVRKAGEVTPIDVEVFPTGAVIPAGERLRISVNALDVPHLAPHLGILTSALSPVTLHSSEQYPSQITLPAVSGDGATGAGGTTPDGVGGLVGDVTGELGGGTGLELPEQLREGLAYDPTGEVLAALERAEAQPGEQAATETSDGLNLLAALRDPTDNPLPVAGILLLGTMLVLMMRRVRR